MGNQEKRSEEGFNRDFIDPKPVETDKEYGVQITEISRKGYGIARVQGFIIFVKSGQVGQNVNISKVGSTFATVEII
ncbi:MAG TPA: TRAM domain-containing protein [Nitrososphaeraceae archaeon]|jgi:predicted RNA-binding protein with TRAM domain